MSELASHPKKALKSVQKLAQAGRHSQALALAEEALAEWPGYCELEWERCFALINVGRYAEAVTQHRRAVQSDPACLDGKFGIKPAWVFDKVGDREPTAQDMESYLFPGEEVVFAVRANRDPLRDFIFAFTYGPYMVAVIIMICYCGHQLFIQRDYLSGAGFGALAILAAWLLLGARPPRVERIIVITTQRLLELNFFRRLTIRTVELGACENVTVDRGRRNGVGDLIFQAKDSFKSPDLKGLRVRRLVVGSVPCAKQCAKAAEEAIQAQPPVRNLSSRESETALSVMARPAGFFLVLISIGLLKVQVYDVLSQPISGDVAGYFPAGPLFGGVGLALGLLCLAFGAQAYRLLAESGGQLWTRLLLWSLILAPGVAAYLFVQAALRN